MQKRTPDYDNVFKTMKSKHKRLFISVINDIFGKNYPMDIKVEILPSEGYLTESETEDGRKEIEEQISDFIIKIENEVYLLECQSYDDGSMTIRIAEYAFIVARQFATWDIGHATIPMPRFSVIYVKRTEKTPKKTVITFIFPDGQKVDYESDNVILEEFTKEEIVEKRLFPYIPFYIARYEKELMKENDVANGVDSKAESDVRNGVDSGNIGSDVGNGIKDGKAESNVGSHIENAVKDLEYFRNEMLRLHEEKELSDDEIVDLMGFVNTIITHITNGNKNEERLVNIMGGTVIETESERLFREGKTAGIAEGEARGEARGETRGAKATISILLDLDYSSDKIVETMQNKMGITKAQAEEYMKRYQENRL